MTRRKRIFLSIGLFPIGMATGALVGLLMSVVTGIPIGGKNVMSAGWSALLTVIGTPLASAFLVRYEAKKWEFFEPYLKHLIPVAFLTLFIPVFGVLMGSPNGDIDGCGRRGLLEHALCVVEYLQEFCV